MRHLLLVTLLLSGPAFGLEPNDGPSGMTCSMFDAGAQIPWQTKEGPQVGLGRYEPGQIAAIFIDVTGGGREFVLNKAGSPLTLKARESGDGPKLHLYDAQGAQTVIGASADTTITCSTYRSVGSEPTMGYAQDIVVFPQLSGHVRAILELPISKVYSGNGGTVTVYRLQHPGEVTAQPPIPPPVDMVECHGTFVAPVIRLEYIDQSQRVVAVWCMNTQDAEHGGLRTLLGSDGDISCRTRIK